MAGNRNQPNLGSIGAVDVESLPADSYAAEDAALGKGVLIQGDDGTDRHNVTTDTDGHLQVDVLTGGGAGVQYDDGDARGDATGNLMMGDDGTNIQSVVTDTDGHLQVDVLSGGGAGEQYADGTAVDPGYKGNIILGTDGSNYQAVSTNATGHVNIADGGNAITVDGSVTANAGTNLNTSALALEAGGNLAGVKTDTGTIAEDTTSIDGKTPALGQALEAASVPVVLPAGQITTLTPPAAITGFAVESGGNLDTIAGDTTSIDGKITACDTGSIAGTVTANAGTNLNTSALALEAGGNLAGVKTDTATIAGDTTSIDGKITACNTGAVVISSGAVTETNSAAIKTAVETIDNAISGSEMQVDVVASLPAGTNNIGDVDVASIANGSINGPGAPTIDSYTNAVISASANTANQSLIAAPGASKQIWVYSVNFLVGTAAGTVSFQDEDDTAISGVMSFALNGGMATSPSGNFAMPLWKVATNKALEVDTVTCDIKGSIQYAIVSV